MPSFLLFIYRKERSEMPLPENSRRLLKQRRSKNDERPL